MKRVIAIICCILIVMSLIACNKKTNTEVNTDYTQEVVGGWYDSDSLIITDEINKVFEKAIAEIDGVEYIPVAYLSKQVVAGINHCILCKATPVIPNAKTTYSIVYIYEDLEGNATVIKIMSSSNDVQNTEEDVVGGWTETTSFDIPEKVMDKFRKACETLTGAIYKPLALLATQTVAGTNYRILCKAKPSVEISNADFWYVIVTVYADLNGNAEIIDTIEFRHIDIYNSVPDTYAYVWNGNIKTYYEMPDETWECEGNTYKYRLQITGVMPNAVTNSTYVYLSNIEEITFEQAYMAAGLSSNLDDYFTPEEAILVEMY